MCAAWYYIMVSVYVLLVCIVDVVCGASYPCHYLSCPKYYNYSVLHLDHKKNNVRVGSFVQCPFVSLLKMKQNEHNKSTHVTLFLG